MGQSFKVDEAMFTQLTDMGFVPVQVREALTQTNNNLDRALEVLTGTGQIQISNPIPITNVDNSSNIPYVPNKDEVINQNKPVNVEDDDVKKAIAESLKGQSTQTNNINDEDLRKALALSLATANAGSTPSNPMEIDESGNIKMSEEEKQINNAILRSLSDVNNSDGSSASTNPIERLKQPGVAAGLKNIGNTCYFNSFLQTYFRIPALQKAVLSFSPPPTPASITSGSSSSINSSQATHMNEKNFPLIGPSLPSSSSSQSEGSGRENDEEQGNKKIRLENTSNNNSNNNDTKKPEPIQDTNTNKISFVKDSDAVEFMLELQRLFANLLLTNQRFVDPSRFLKTLKDRSGSPLKIGNQEDVSEFNDIFLETLQRGLALHRKLEFGGLWDIKNELIDEKENSNNNENENTNSGFINKMFYGSAVQYFSFREADGTPFEKATDSVFNHLILRVGKDLPSLHTSLDSYVIDPEMDYKTDHGHNTKAASTLWFRSLPPVLMFQQSRVNFNVENKSSTKSVDPLYFEKEIFMDRYILKNRGEVTKIRNVVNDWKSELQKIESRLDTFTNFKGRGHSLDQILLSTLEYFKDSPDSVLDHDIARTLQKRYEIEKTRIEDLKSEVDRLKSQINSAFDHMSSYPYTLYAVWVHQGVAGSGHYWAYLRDPINNKWTKFNDMNVSIVDSETVMKESIGGHQSSSAYFLIYMNKELVESGALGKLQGIKDMEVVEISEKGLEENNVVDLVSDGSDEAALLIPDALRIEIEKSNEEFKKSLDNTNNKNIQDSLLNRFMKEYNEKLSEIEQKTKELIVSKDQRLISFSVFLESMGMKDIMKGELIRGLYCVVFEKGLHLDIDSQTFNQVRDKVGSDLFQQALIISSDSSPIDDLKQQHLIFRETTYWYNEALRQMLARNWQDCCRDFQRAMKRQEELTYLAPSRTKDIQNLAQVVVYEIYLDASEKQNRGVVPDQGWLSALVAISLSILSSSDPIVQFVSEGFSRMAYEPLSKIASVITHPGTFNWNQIPTKDIELPKKFENEDWEKLVEDLHANIEKVALTFDPVFKGLSSLLVSQSYSNNNNNNNSNSNSSNNSNQTIDQNMMTDS